MAVFIFLWDFLKVRHAVTEMLERKDGIQLTVSPIPLQKIKEFQKVFSNQKEISVSMYMFLKKCWSMIGRSLYPLLNDLLKLNHCLSRVPFISQGKESSLPNFRNTTRHHSTCQRASPPLQHKHFTAFLSSPHKSKACIKKLTLN